MQFAAPAKGNEKGGVEGLGGHPKAATRGHLRTGQRSVATFKTGQ
jgi:hypothetical protein